MKEKGEAQMKKKNELALAFMVGAIAVFIMGLSMFISFAGLTNIVKFGYGYCGYFAVVIVIVPLLTVGVYKNRKYLKEHPEQTAVEEKTWNLCEE